MKDKQDRAQGLQNDLDALLSEAMKQAGVQQTMEINQAYQDLLDRANTTASAVPVVRVINATRTGG